MVDLLCGNVSLSGWSAADLVVGKAAALLFVYAKVKEVYGKVLSEEAEKVLKEHGVPCSFETLAPHIINRSGNDICPMEKLVKDVENPAVALEILKKLYMDNHDTQKSAKKIFALFLLWRTVLR